MNYTSYFLEQVNTHHNPAKLSNKQLTRVMNIIKTQAEYSTLIRCKDVDVNGMERYILNKKLNELTGRKDPIVLWQEMIKLS